MSFLPQPPQARLAFLDWARGFAAVVMLQGHVFHSFTRSDLRGEGPYVLSQFVGGLPPALFLFLTGITLAFLMDRRERQGAAPRVRVLAAARRGGYLLGLAFLFRIQMWLFGWPGSRVSDILRVDILNCMGVTILLMAAMAVFQTQERIRLCAILGIAMAAASPVISQLDWSNVSPAVKHYLAPDYSYFSLFPWGAFLAFGVSAGSILRVVSPDQIQRVVQWASLAGISLILGGRYFSNLPFSIYPKSDFWLDSPALVAIKLGLILLVLAFAFVWTQYGARNWSWVRQLGVTSLLVYWVHIELVYGRWLSGWKEALNIPQTAGAALAVIVLMVLLSLARSNWAAIRAAGRYYFWTPKRVSGSGD